MSIEVTVVIDDDDDDDTGVDDDDDDERPADERSVEVSVVDCMTATVEPVDADVDDRDDVGDDDVMSFSGLISSSFTFVTHNLPLSSSTSSSSSSFIVKSNSSGLVLCSTLMNASGSCDSLNESCTLMRESASASSVPSHCTNEEVDDD